MDQGLQIVVSIMFFLDPCAMQAKNCIVQACARVLSRSAVPMLLDIFNTFPYTFRIRMAWWWHGMLNWRLSCLSEQYNCSFSHVEPGILPRTSDSTCKYLQRSQNASRLLRLGRQASDSIFLHGTAFQLLQLLKTDSFNPFTFYHIFLYLPLASFSISLSAPLLNSFCSRYLRLLHSTFPLQTGYLSPCSCTVHFAHWNHTYGM